MINFPSPASSPWTDPSGVIWEHDGDGWINKVDLIVGGGGGDLPNGGLAREVISKNSDTDQDYDWNRINADGGGF